LFAVVFGVFGLIRQIAVRDRAHDRARSGWYTARRALFELGYSGAGFSRGAPHGAAQRRNIFCGENRAGRKRLVRRGLRRRNPRLGRRVRRAGDFGSYVRPAHVTALSKNSITSPSGPLFIEILRAG
jgi:hypothetical protein